MTASSSVFYQGQSQDGFHGKPGFVPKLDCLGCLCGLWPFEGVVWGIPIFPSSSGAWGVSYEGV